MLKPWMSALYKYPRTPHLPWSPGGNNEDSYLADIRNFLGREVVVTEKMDGENTTLYRDHLHARSLDSLHHVSRDWVKALHGRIRHEIPEGYRLCGENLYARHSIAYENLTSYFYLFSVWNADNVALSWDETVEWAALLGLDLAPEIHRGEFDEKFLRQWEVDTGRQEGYVVRITDRFDYQQFPRSVAKWVRPGHVQTPGHWMHAEIIPNTLAGDQPIR